MTNAEYTVHGTITDRTATPSAHPRGTTRRDNAKAGNAVSAIKIAFTTLATASAFAPSLVKRNAGAKTSG